LVFVEAWQFGGYGVGFAVIYEVHLGISGWEFHPLFHFNWERKEWFHEVVK
jgi:hypothetical protein